MLSKTIKIRSDENATENVVAVKKDIVAGEQQPVKRAVLGQLQNRNGGATRAILGKEAVEKDAKQAAQLNFKNAKARVDTHWKKDELPIVTTTAAAATTTKGGLQRRAIVRSNSQLTAAAAAQVPLRPPMGAADAKQLPLEKQVKQVKKKEQNVLELKRTVAQKPAATAAVEKTAPPLESSETHSTRLIKDVEDIDCFDAGNLVLVSEYVNDIYDYLYQVETKLPIQVDYMKDHLEAQPRMRSVLIDWINEVHLQFHLAAETFHLAVTITDQYLQQVKDVKRNQLQLIGATSLFIATKYEELFPPAIADFVYITDDTYSAKEIRLMEIKIFGMISGVFARPLSIHFLRRFSKAACAEDRHHAMAKYFLELAAVEYELVSYKPSEIAAASLMLSLHLLNDDANQATGFNRKHWTATLEHYSRYKAEQLEPISRKIAAVAMNAPFSKLKSVYNKYQAKKFYSISARKELYGELMTSIVDGTN